MDIKTALTRWEYPSKRRDKLEEICVANAQQYMKNGIIDIPDDAIPIYIPDKRYKDYLSHYKHIMNAIAKQQEILFNSIHISDQALATYIQQLEKGGLITGVNGCTQLKKTSNCVLTLLAEEWFSKDAKNRTEELCRLLKIIMPNGLIALV